MQNLTNQQKLIRETLADLQGIQNDLKRQYNSIQKENKYLEIQDKDRQAIANLYSQQPLQKYQPKEDFLQINENTDFYRQLLQSRQEPQVVDLLQSTISLTETLPIEQDDTVQEIQSNQFPQQQMEVISLHPQPTYEPPTSIQNIRNIQQMRQRVVTKPQNKRQQNQEKPSATVAFRYADVRRTGISPVVKKPETDKLKQRVQTDQIRQQYEKIHRKRDQENESENYIKSRFLPNFQKQQTPEPQVISVIQNKPSNVDIKMEPVEPKDASDYSPDLIEGQIDTILREVPGSNDLLSTFKNDIFSIEIQPRQRAKTDPQDDILNLESLKILRAPKQQITAISIENTDQQAGNVLIDQIMNEQLVAPDDFWRNNDDLLIASPEGNGVDSDGSVE